MKIATQGYATCCRMDVDTAYKTLAEAGFEAIDWAIDCQWEKGKVRQCWSRKSIEAGVIKQNCIYDEDIDTIVEHYTPELEAMKKYGLVPTQAHAPFPAYCVENPDFLDYAIETYKKAILLCERAGCQRVVIHGISRRAHETMIDDAEIHRLNMKLYTSLIPTLLQTNVTVLLENLFATTKGKRYAGTCCDADDAINYIDTLNEMAGKECFGLCFDVGHHNLLHRNLSDYIEKVGTRIKALHIHDNDMEGDLHLMPYSGTVRWVDLYTSLKKIGYNGDLNFETYKQTDPYRCENEMIMPSLVFIRQCGEFFRSKIQG